MFNRWLQSNYHIDNVMTDIGSKSMKLPKLDEGTIGELIAFLNEQTVHSVSMCKEKKNNETEKGKQTIIRETAVPSSAF